MPKPFADLQNAIVDVLRDAEYSPKDDGSCTVSRKLLRTLEAEYNIHFVEPDEAQFEIIKYV